MRVVVLAIVKLAFKIDTLQNINEAQLCRLTTHTQHAVFQCENSDALSPYRQLGIVINLLWTMNEHPSLMTLISSPSPYRLAVLFSRMHDESKHMRDFIEMYINTAAAQKKMMIYKI